ENEYDRDREDKATSRSSIAVEHRGRASRSSIAVEHRGRASRSCIAATTTPQGFLETSLLRPLRNHIRVLSFQRQCDARIRHGIRRMRAWLGDGRGPYDETTYPPGRALSDAPAAALAAPEHGRASPHRSVLRPRADCPAHGAAHQSILPQGSA